MPYRPTKSIVRKSLFDKLSPFHYDSVLDLFSGTGIMGFEAASRGANSITFVEQHGKCIDLLKEKISDTSWKKSIGCLKLISVLTDSAPEQIDYLLPELIPLITSQTSNPKREVKEESTRALNKCCSRISNPDVIPLIPKLVEANKDPSKTIIAIDALMETTFVKSFPDELPPLVESPQVTTEPSDLITANAVSVDAMDTAFVRSKPDELPPLSGSPQVTTTPVALIAAKAVRVLALLVK